MADGPTVSLQSDGLQPGHDIFCTPNNDAFHASSLYSELDVAQQEIRLVKLWPGSGDDAIECTLLPGAPLLDLKGRYTAPSYCAGSAKNTEPIVLNGTTFNVFANLAHALREVRQFWSTTYGDRECLLWIDQISINQYDINERSSQVRSMREIYQYAEQVLVCLSTQRCDPRGMSWLVGLARDVRPRGFDEFPEAERRYMIRSNRNDWINPELATLFDGDHTFRIVDHIRENIRNATFRKGLLASCEVLEAPWFTRAWVFQEFIVAANVHFLYSGVHASWQTLLPVWTAICMDHNRGFHKIIFETIDDEGVRSYLPEWAESSELFGLLLGDAPKAALKGLESLIRIKAQWCEKHDLLELLAHSRDRNSSDPRDKVYACIGLASPAYEIVPNYSHSTDRVLIDTSMKIIEAEDSLDILWHAAASEPRHDSTLPSWVADWRTRQVDRHPPISLYPELKKSEANVSFHILETRHGTSQALQVDGVMIDMLDSDSRNSRRKGCFYTSVKGFTGGCSRESRQDDEIWVLRGCRSPLILRSQERFGYKLVSAATYTHQFPMKVNMSLEMMMEREKKQQEGWRTISLI